MCIKAKVVKTVFATAFGMMVVAGCGFGSARDGLSVQDGAAPAVDIQTLKEAALSNLAKGIHPTVNARNGCVAELTVDPALQRIVSDVLSRHADTNDTAIGWAILLSANDGAVLALADCGGVAEDPHPFALTRLYTPGHLLSTMTVAAALDAGIATPDSELFTNASEAFFYQYKLPSDGGHIWESTLSVSNGLIFSSNVVLSKLGILVGRDRESAVLNGFGIGIRSGIGFSDEALGRLVPPERWCKVDRARIPIGQGIEVTAIQIARAYATLANHGRRVDPYIVKRVEDASGNTLYEHVAPTSGVRAVCQNAADTTCSILEAAVEADDLKGFDGIKEDDPVDITKCLVPRRATGRRAAVEGVRIAGKTGTALRRKAGSYEYETQRYIASFAGIFPAEDPGYVLVVCYETRRDDGVPYMHQGGGRPAIAFSEIVKSIVRRQNGTTPTCYGREDTRNGR